MIIKAIHVMLSVLVAVSVWCAAVVFAVLIASLALHLAVMGGLTTYHLMYP